MRAVLVIVPAYECYDYLVKCLASVRAQNYANMRVVVVDDCSTDLRQRALVEDVNGIHGWMGVINPERRLCPRNIWDAVQLAEPDPQDLILICDGDDWLPHEGVVSRIVAEFDAHPDCWVAFGSYEPHPADPTCHPAEPYPTTVVRERSFRHYSTCYNHPLAFLALAFQQLEPADLQYPDGEWFGSCYDQTLMFPLLEMAGPAHRFIPDVLYAYRSDNSQSEARVLRDDAERVSAELRARPKKPRLYLSDNGLTLAPEDRAAVITQTMLDAGTRWCVETGTGYGDMAYRIAQMEWVERVVTIEQDAERYAAAVAKLVGSPNVLPVLGDSREVLRAIVATVPAAVWWLDAHRDDWWTGDPETVCPIMDELYLILSQDAPHTILIDDARLFGQATGYPTLEAVSSHVRNLADAKGRTYTVTTSHDIVRIVPQ